MRRILPLCFLLAACGGDEAAPVVVSDSDVAVVQPAQADALIADAADAPADVEPAPAPAPAPVPAPAPAPTPAAAPIPPGLAALPGEAAWYKDGQEELVIFQKGSSPTSGELVYTPHPDLDQIYDTWTIEGNTLTFMGTTYTFESADGAGSYRFQGPQGEMVLTLAAG